MINPYYYLSEHFPFLWTISQIYLPWFKILGVLSPYIILLAIPFAKAKRENKRLESKRKSLIDWLTKIYKVSESQLSSLTTFTEFLEDKEHFFEPRFEDIPVEHLLQYPDDDLQKLFYSKLKNKFKDGSSMYEITNDKWRHSYIDIIVGMHQLKNNYAFLKQHYDEFIAKYEPIKQKTIKTNNEYVNKIEKLTIHGITLMIDKFPVPTEDVISPKFAEKYKEVFHQLNKPKPQEWQDKKFLIEYLQSVIDAMIDDPLFNEINMLPVMDMPKEYKKIIDERMQLFDKYLQIFHDRNLILKDLYNNCVKYIHETKDVELQKSRFEF